MFKMILASGNKNKYREMNAVLEQVGIDLIFGGEIENPPEVEETGATYEENALLKARAWMEQTGLPTIADDSGIEVDALGGAPGVHSARAVPGSDADRTAWLLSEMRNRTDRSARFVACLAAVFPGMAHPVLCQRACEGRLANSPSGAFGFGYDPIFIPNGYEMTFSELGDPIKQKISHRALALKCIAEILESMIQSSTVA